MTSYENEARRALTGPAGLPPEDELPTEDIPTPKEITAVEPSLHRDTAVINPEEEARRAEKKKADRAYYNKIRQDLLQDIATRQACLEANQPTKDADASINYKVRHIKNYIKNQELISLTPDELEEIKSLQKIIDEIGIKQKLQGVFDITNTVLG